MNGGRRRDTFVAFVAFDAFRVRGGDDQPASFATARYSLLQA